MEDHLVEGFLEFVSWDELVDYVNKQGKEWGWELREARRLPGWDPLEAQAMRMIEEEDVSEPKRSPHYAEVWGTRLCNIGSPGKPRRKFKEPIHLGWAGAGWIFHSRYWREEKRHCLLLQLAEWIRPSRSAAEPCTTRPIDVQDNNKTKHNIPFIGESEPNADRVWRDLLEVRASMEISGAHISDEQLFTIFVDYLNKNEWPKKWAVLKKARDEGRDEFEALKEYMDATRPPVKEHT